jgi:hypothetical protein
MTFLAEYVGTECPDTGGRLKATQIVADDWDGAERLAFFDNRATVIVGRKTG